MNKMTLAENSNGHGTANAGSSAAIVEAASRMNASSGDAQVLRRIRRILVGDKLAALEARCEAILEQVNGLENGLGQKLGRLESEMKELKAALDRQQGAQTKRIGQQEKQVERSIEQLHAVCMRVADLEVQGKSEAERGTRLEGIADQLPRLADELRGEISSLQEAAREQRENHDRHEDLVAEALDQLREVIATKQKERDAQWQQLEERSVERLEALEQKWVAGEKARGEKERGEIAGLLRNLAAQLDPKVQLDPKAEGAG